MKWKRECWDVFQHELKLHILFLGILVGKFKCEKWGDHQKRKFFINNVGEVRISFKEHHQGLIRLHAHLGGTSFLGRSEVSLSPKEGIFSEAEQWRMRMFFRTYYPYLSWGIFDLRSHGGWDGFRSPPPICSLDWQKVEVCCFCQQVIQSVLVRYLLALFFFWWHHHILKAPTDIPSFLRISMGCLIFACV